MEIQIYPSIHPIDADEWNSLWPIEYPFTRHAFLAALEDSNSVGGESGWITPLRGVTEKW